ncbi:asparagine synthase (glutamine-hydrolyzing) [uncultured Maribacter sp.]|uniref:asparagine synthase (glutamine-hydrolyzing) n=1 Tax=uncultured Maribacter sp. TaxID=431308 RepID=UPI002605095B|nr:asparagine synthase (glutamine-hydrolyzing) [uncultured Maribacter sp.]
MCGIYMTNLPLKEEEVLSKLKSIQYRGPDYTGVSKVENVTLGHLRLSILDLDPRSNQPMVYENLHLIFNGEIYNYKEIRDELILLGYKFKTESDTEVLLLGFKEWKSEVLHKLNGMFSFCIYDIESKKIFSARDRLGVKPFYYYWKNGDFEICSQLRPLIKGRSINKEAISIYLDCRYVPSPYSMIEDVKKLPPGCYMIFDLETNQLSISEYWNLKEEKIEKITYQEAKKEVHNLLINSVKIRLQSDVPIGSFLSGGIDSALVSCIASKISDKPVNTFSIGFDNPKYDESKIARKFAKIMKSNHTETICKPKDVLALIPKLVEVYDEPFADSSALPSLLLNSLTKKDVTVAISGDGGDESFLGYNHFEWLTKVNLFFKTPYLFRNLISKTFLINMFNKPAESLKNILQAKSINEFIQYIFVGFGTININRDLSWLKEYDKFKKSSKNYLQRAADLNIKLWLENDSNVKVDRASMAYSVEVRSPFLDYRIIELARKLPISYRYVKGKRKRILRDILKEYIPEEVFNQPKSGFSIPLGDWIRTDLKDEFVNVLNDDFLNKVPNLDVVKFKKQFSQHMNGKKDYATNIWKVYILARWYKEFNF